MIPAKMRLHPYGCEDGCQIKLIVHQGSVSGHL